MSNMVTIGSKPAEGASAAPAQAENKPGAPAQSLQVTDRAIKRIRVAIARRAFRLKKAGCALGSWAVAAPGFLIQLNSTCGRASAIVSMYSMGFSFR